MTTLYASARNLTVSIGFFVLVAVAMAISTLARGSTVIGIVCLVAAFGLAVLAVVLHRAPANELRVSSELIELSRPDRKGRPGRVIGSFSRADTGGSIDLRRHVYRGRVYWSVVPAGGELASGFPVDDFVPSEIHAAAELHGWRANILE